MSRFFRWLDKSIFCKIEMHFLHFKLQLSRWIQSKSPYHTYQVSENRHHMFNQNDDQKRRKPSFNRIETKTMFVNYIIVFFYFAQNYKGNPSFLTLNTSKLVKKKNSPQSLIQQNHTEEPGLPEQDTPLEGGTCMLQRALIGRTHLQYRINHQKFLNHFPRSDELES